MSVSVSIMQQTGSAMQSSCARSPKVAALRRNPFCALTPYFIDARNSKTNAPSRWGSGDSLGEWRARGHLPGSLPTKIVVVQWKRWTGTGLVMGAGIGRPRHKAPPEKGTESQDERKGQLLFRMLVNRGRRRHEMRAFRGPAAEDDDRHLYGHQRNHPVLSHQRNHPALCSDCSRLDF